MHVSGNLGSWFSSIHMHWGKLQIWENLGIPAGILFGTSTDQKRPSAQLIEQTEQKGQEGKSRCIWGGTAREWVQGMFPVQMVQCKIQSIFSWKIVSHETTTTRHAKVKEKNQISVTWRKLLLRTILEVPVFLNPCLDSGVRLRCEPLLHHIYMNITKISPRKGGIKV